MWKRWRRPPWGIASHSNDWNDYYTQRPWCEVGKLLAWRPRRDLMEKVCVVCTKAGGTDGGERCHMANWTNSDIGEIAAMEDPIPDVGLDGRTSHIADSYSV